MFVRRMPHMRLRLPCAGDKRKKMGAGCRQGGNYRRCRMQQLYEKEVSAYRQGRGMRNMYEGLPQGKTCEIKSADRIFAAGVFFAVWVKMRREPPLTGHRFLLSSRSSFDKAKAELFCQAHRMEKAPA